MNKSDLIAGFIEGAVTTAVLLTLVMLIFGVEIFIALIPVMVLLTLTGVSLVIGLAIIFCRKVVRDIESTYSKDTDEGFIFQQSIKGVRQADSKSWRQSRID